MRCCLFLLLLAAWPAVHVAAAPGAERAPTDGLSKPTIGAMVVVPAGEFWMGSDDNENEKPRHRVHLDRFYIDTYEVTNGQYDEFVRVTRWTPPAYRHDVSLSGSSQPVVGVSWNDADAYCKWAGKRLPTEAEWEKAARGGDGRTYPWGNTWERGRAHFDERDSDKTMPVGSYPSGTSSYGAYDMAGNALEWVADWYDADYYHRSQERNPPGPDSGELKVVRGGAWIDPPLFLVSSVRGANSPDARNTLTGFRCATSAR